MAEKKNTFWNQFNIYYNACHNVGSNMQYPILRQIKTSKKASQELFNLIPITTNYSTV